MTDKHTEVVGFLNQGAINKSHIFLLLKQSISALVYKYENKIWVLFKACILPDLFVCVILFVQGAQEGNIKGGKVCRFNGVFRKGVICTDLCPNT